MMIRGLIIQILILLQGCCYSFLLDNNCQLDIKPCNITNNALRCSNIGLLVVPRISANVSAIYFGYNNLTTLEDHAFDCFTNISGGISMYLNYNQLYYIANDAFIGIGNIITLLDLSDNNLTSLSQWLGQLQSLNTLVLQGNPITHFDGFAHIGNTLLTLGFGSENITFWPVEFKYLRNLQVLAIADVSLKHLPDDAFRGFEQSLLLLSIYNTRLEKIPSAICHLQHLRDLTIWNNSYLEERLTPVVQPCVGNKTQVLYLDIIGNNIEKYPNIYDMFNDSNIVRIDLKKNQLRFMDLIVLQTDLMAYEIDLDSNKFVRIPSALNLYTNLTRLYLSNNLIQSVEDYDLFKLEKLRVLSLEHNPLEFISSGALKNNRDLNDLYLSDTKLIQIPSAVQHMPGLWNLQLGGLQIECTCNMVYLKTWDISGISFGRNSNCLLSNVSIHDYIKYSLPRCTNS